MARRRRRSRPARPEPARSDPARRRGPRHAGIALTVACAGALAAIGLVLVLRGDGATEVTVEVPELSVAARRGATSFESHCARCHGERAAGTDRGPPLVHRIYEPSHHGDAAIHRAVRLGVRQHHWRFGPMPKVAIPDRALDDVIAYIRELQRANGIR